MRFFSLILLLPAMVCPCCARGQNTGAQATPQTQSAAPAGISGSGASQPQQPAGRPSRAGGSAARGGARRGGPQNRATVGSSSPRTVPPAPAANGSITVIGGSKLNPNGASAEGVALPGVSMPHNALGIAAGTSIHVRLQQTIDSGHARNGDSVQGTLTEALGKLPNGAPVTLTVVAAAPAGEIGSSGVLSLQVTSINGEQVLSQVITAEGKEGQKLLPDDAPARGTEAVFTPDTAITVPAA